VYLAGRKLRNAPRRAADEEDVALSAFDSFCQGAAQGRFPQLRDRDDLWGLLIVITARKALNLARHEMRQKRGGGRVVNDATPSGAADSSGAESPVDQVVGREPTPAFAAQVGEEFRRLLDKLSDGELRQIAIWKMEGYTNAEIAARIDCAIPTVERRLRLIRKTWDQEGG
jgi:DNA-directed RNA polymerase specialized sigma24 family protein